MKYLIDTQIAIWIIENNPRLTTNVKGILLNPVNEILFSQVSLIELSIKLKIEKLPNFIIGIDSVTNQLIENGLTFLPIQNEHIWAYQQIPFFENHRDPFDRLILATSFSEKLPIITSDEKFSQYTDLLSVIRN